MSSDQKGPSYILAFLSGTLLILGGVVRAASRTLLPNRVFGSTYRIVMRALPSINFGIGPTNILLQVSASLGIISGIAVLIGAVMLSSRAKRHAFWGAVILLFSTVGMLGGGGFLIGSLLGMLAGILAIVWRPLPRLR